MTSASGKPPKDNPVAAISYAIAANGVGGLPVWMVSTYAPQIQDELGFEDSGLGLLIGVYFLVSTVTGLVVGRLVQNWGWRTGIAFSAAISALCFAAMVTLAHAWIVLVIAMCIGALSNNSSQPAANLAIAANVPSNRQGLAFGLKQAALPLSTVLIGLSVPLFAHGEEWRTAFLTAAALGLLLAAGVVARPLLRSARGRRGALGSTARRPTAPRERRRYKIPRALVLLSVGAGFGTAAVVSLGGFLVVFSVEAGLTPTEGGALLAAGSIVGGVVRVVSGHLADRRGKRHLVVVAFMMAAGSLGFLVFAFFGTNPAGLIAGTLFTFGLGWSWNGLMHFAVARYITLPMAVATSVLQTAMSLGSAIGPILFGVLTEWTFTAAWLVAAAFLATGSGFVLLARRALSREVPPTPTVGS